MIDYLIVGSGLAGIAFSEQALAHGKTIAVFDDGSHNSSRVAAGLYNPVILKRLSGLADAVHQLEVMNAFYDTIEKKLETQVRYPLPTLRKFFSVEEQNNWFVAADKPLLAPFLSTNIVSAKYDGINSPFGYGEVLQTGYVDTEKLLDAYRDYLSGIDALRQETIVYDDLDIAGDIIEYRGTKARHIVFADGFGIRSNPFFSYLPLAGTKGELLLVKAPELKLDVILNTNVFILPVGNSLFKIGATYNWTDKTTTPTEEGMNELIQRAKEILECDFEVIGHSAGIRPTVKDRKPLIGTHQDHPNVHILNGLGTRGVMLGPAMAQTLFNNIESGIPIPKELDIKRFSLSQRL